MQIKNVIKSMSYKIKQLTLRGIISWLAAKVANCAMPWVKNLLIDWFISHYKVKIIEALETDPKKYPNLESFFVRALKPEARPILGEARAIISPADGTIMQCGKIIDGVLIQAKGKFFSAEDLVGTKGKEFFHGDFVVIYLSPKDYHRVHMPVKGQLQSMQVFPGGLFSVQPRTITRVDQVFTRNERVVNFFITDFGPLAVVLVGAIIVGSIEMEWQGVVVRGGCACDQLAYDYSSREIQVASGDEIGKFRFGSTVILLFPENAAKLDVVPGQSIKMGERLGVELVSS